MVMQQVALVSQTPSVPLSEIVKVAAALQKQVTRDFAPIWEVSATVDSFAKLEDVPLGYWPIMVRDDVITNFQAAGIHLDDNGQPFSLVQASDDWAMTSSHEVLEMLADPFGERVIRRQAAGAGREEGRRHEAGASTSSRSAISVSESDETAYTVNDISGVDFYAPHFYEPDPARHALQLHRPAIAKPAPSCRADTSASPRHRRQSLVQIRVRNGSDTRPSRCWPISASSQWVDEHTRMESRRSRRGVPRDYEEDLQDDGESAATCSPVCRKDDGTTVAAMAAQKMIEAKVAKLLKIIGESGSLRTRTRRRADKMRYMARKKKKKISRPRTREATRGADEERSHQVRRSSPHEFTQERITSSRTEENQDRRGQTLV